MRLRGALDAVPAYVAGKPPVAREGLTVYKVSSNENPYPPLPSVLDVVRDAAATMNRYPDMGVSALTDALAAHLDVPRERIATGTGSVGVLGQIMQATCDAGDEVVYAWRSFEAYPIVVALSGATSVQVPLTAEHRHDLPAMLAAITERTKVVMVCTPNNPTGPSTASHQKSRMAKDSPSGSLIHSVICSMKALTTKVKSPSVRTIAGKDRTFAIGLTTALMTPKRRATSRTVVNFEAKVEPPSPSVMPSTRNAATHSAMPLTTTLMRKLAMGSVWQ